MGQIQSSVIDGVIRYFRATSPGKMMFHLLWLFCILMMLSTSYIVTFHFQPVIELFHHSHSIDHFRSELNTTINVDTEVNNELNTLITTTGAQRAYVFRYHNGIPSVNNIPFMFHTNTHEVIRAGANRAIIFSQRLPTSITHSMNMEFLHRKCVVLREINKNLDSANYWHYQQRNTIALIRCPFFSPRGDLLGFVGIDYTEPPSQTLLQNSNTMTENSAQKLGTIFSPRRN